MFGKGKRYRAGVLRATAPASAGPRGHRPGPAGHGRVLALLLALALGGCGLGTAERPPAAGPPAPTSRLPPASQAAAEPSGKVLAGFIAFGDFGGGAAQRQVAAAMERWAGRHRVDALVTTGDNVYELGEPERFREQLDEPYRRLRRGRPMWVTLGNHDVAAGYGDEQLRYLGLPDLPYARKLEGVGLAFLDGNRPDGQQARWLEAWLRAPGPRFRVVVFHQPAYSCGFHGPTPAVHRWWVPLLERYRAALVLNGHDHHYERFRSPAGVTYVVTGGGGRELYPVHPACAVTAARQAVAVKHHFVGVEVRAGSLALTAVGADGQVIDRAVITR